MISVTSLWSFTLIPFPNNRIIDWSKLKAFADDKLITTQNLKFVHGRVENIVGNGENAGFFFSHNVFKSFHI